MTDTALLPLWKLHRRILAVLGIVVGLLIAILLTGLAHPGLDRLVAVAGTIMLVLGYGVHAALSTVFASFANSRRGVVFAHLASPAALVALGALRHALHA
jgi:uncharacterized protein YacL